MNIPAGFSTAEIDALKVANPGAVFALPIVAGVTVPVDVAPSRVLGWLDLLEGPIEAGETLILPGPIGIFLAGLTKGGCKLLRASLTNAAPTERWSPSKIQAAMTGLELPKT
jgi:hypothetical protein